MIREPSEDAHIFNDFVVLGETRAFILIARVTRKYDILSCSPSPVADYCDGEEVVSGQLLNWEVVRAIKTTPTLFFISVRF